MATFQTFIDTIYRDNNDGKKFERFVKWFLKNDPEWATQTDEVWLWNEWPDRWGIDKGIDLVFRHRNGEIWAVQAKCYSSNYSVTKADMDSFLSESNREIISRRLLIASTDRIGKNARETCAGQEKPVTRFMLSDFEKAAIDYPDDYKDLRRAKRKKRPTPYDYQKDAITKVVRSFKTTDRGQLIMACGTGKTFTTLWIKERMRSKNTLVLVPSLNLLAQTFREWTYASKKTLKVCCVCSDQAVAHRGKEENYDEVIQSVSDAPIPVLNQPSEIAQFLEGDGDKVVFSTYQSSPLIEEVHKRKKIDPFDLVVADEAHRCASSGKMDSTFTTILDEKKIKAKKRLFTTATPRMHSLRVRKAAEDRGVEIFGMDDTNVFGEVFHTLSFGEAISRKPPLLTDYQVIIVGVDDAMIANWIDDRELVKTASGKVVTDAETLAAQIGLLKATRDYDLKRVISFHGRVKGAENFAAGLEQAQTIVKKRNLPKGKINADYVKGTMQTDVRLQKLRSLRDSGSDQISILSNARCLAEGVDVPTLDGIAFIDPRTSEVDIVQAVGRAIRLSKDKSIGSIVIPVFIQSGDDAEEVLEQSSFKKIWWVINALKAHDGVLAEQLDEIRTEMGRRSKQGKRRTGVTKIILDLPKTVDIGFADALTTKLVEQTTASWNFWFGLLERYVESEGDAIVPQKHITCAGYKLGAWVGRIRRFKDQLSPDQIKRLESLKDWAWDADDARWERGFKYLKEFHLEFGHSNPIRIYKTKDGFPLGMWVGQQITRRNNPRQRYETGFWGLTPEREKRLDGLGIIWNVLEAAWQQHLLSLRDFIKQHGHARPEYKTVLDGVPIGKWVSDQRYRYSIGKLSDNRINILENLKGWVWDWEHFVWNQNYEKWKKTNTFYAENIELEATEIKIIKQWVDDQRKRKKHGLLSERRICILDNDPNWSWGKREIIQTKEAIWEECYNHLKLIHDSEGHAAPKRGVKTKNNYDLGIWISTQRRNRKIGKLPTIYIDRLNELKLFSWDPKEDKWKKGYAELLQYTRTFGSASVKRDYVSPSGFNLGEWVHNLRSKSRSANLKSDKRILLEALDGWVWRT